MCFVTNLTVTFVVGSPVEISMIVFPPAKHDFHKSVSSVAYLGYGRHGSCHGRHFDRGAKIAQ